MKFNVKIEIELPDEYNEEDIELMFCGMIDKRNYSTSKNLMTIYKIYVGKEKEIEI